MSEVEIVHDLIEQAFLSAATVLSGVSTEQMAQPTPCVSWTVNGLVNHIVGGPDFYADTVEAGTAPSRAESPNYTTGDFQAAFDAGAARALAAFASRAPWRNR